MDDQHGTYYRRNHHNDQDKEKCAFENKIQINNEFDNFINMEKYTVISWNLHFEFNLCNETLTAFSCNPLI